MAGWRSSPAAGTGLGRGIAEELAKEGAIDRRRARSTRPPASGRPRSCRARGRGARLRDGRLEAATRSTRRSPRSPEDFGRLDIVVNNAGISRVGPHTQDVTDEDWHDSIAVMQTGVFYCMRAAGRIMLPQQGRVRRQHLVDPRLLAQPRAHDLLRAEGGGDHDDPGRRGRVGAARRARQRDRARASCARRCGTPTSPAGRSTSSSTSTPSRCTASARRRGRQAGRLPVLGRRRLRHGSRAHDRRRADVDPGRIGEPASRRE